MEAWASRYRCELIVKFILAITNFQVFGQPVQSVFNYTKEQLMQFITLRKPIDILQSTLQQLVGDWMYTQIGLIINTVSS